MAEYEVLAVRYGTLATRRHDIFYRYGVYGEPDGPLQMDYYFWVVRDGTRTILLDTGFHSDAAKRRGRTPLVEPVDALAGIGITPEDVDEIIVSHFHYDHIGNLAAFPGAHLTMQRREFDFWTSPVARRPQFAAPTEVSEIEYLVTAAAEGRVSFLTGDGNIAPGIDARLCGGHCPGQQLITVDTGNHQVVLASDALHLYEEMERDMPFDVFSDLEETYKTLDTLREDERKGMLVVAGHDPRVMERFERLDGPAGDLAVRIS